MLGSASRRAGNAAEGALVAVRRGLFAAVVAAAVVACHNVSPPERASEIDAGDPGTLQRLQGHGFTLDGWVEQQASAVLSNRRHCAGLRLAGVNVQTGMADESLSLRIEAGDAPSDTVKIADLGPFEVYYPLLPDAAERDTVAFSVSCTKVFTPASLGTSQDDRSLSWQLQQIALVDLATLGEKLPESFTFPRGDERNRCVVGVYGDGWVTDSALVTLHNLHGRTALEVRAMCPPGVLARMEDWQVSANGYLVNAGPLPDQGNGYYRAEWPLPPQVRSSQKVAIRITPGGTWVPSERGLNADTRRLSCRLDYIGLR